MFRIFIPFIEFRLVNFYFRTTSMIVTSFVACVDNFVVFVDSVWIVMWIVEISLRALLGFDVGNVDNFN